MFFFFILVCPDGENDLDGICCSVGKVIQNGRCKAKCDNYYNEINGICSCPNFQSNICCPVDHDIVDGICCPQKNNNLNGICCPNGRVNQNGKCKKKCTAPNYVDDNGTCICATNFVLIGNNLVRGKAICILD